MLGMATENLLLCLQEAAVDLGQRVLLMLHQFRMIHTQTSELDMDHFWEGS